MKRLVASALVVSLLATACVTSTPLKPSAIESTRDIDWIRIETSAGETIELVEPVVMGDSLVGSLAEVRERDRDQLESVAIPLDDVRAAWIKRLSIVRTALVAGAVLMIPGLFYGITCSIGSPCT